MRTIPCTLMMVLILACSAAAQDVSAPSVINYSGRLYDPQTAGPMNGNHNLIFRLYDAATAGNLQWSRQFPVFLSPDGAFNVQLSDTGTILPESPSNTLAQAFLNSPPLHLSIEVSGQGGELPRTALNSLPYAFLANHAASAESAQYAGITDAGMAEAVSATNGGFAVSATTTNEILRIDASQLNSSGTLAFNSGSSNTVEIVGDLKVNGPTLDFQGQGLGGNIAQAAQSSPGPYYNWTNSYGDGFLIFNLQEVDLSVKINDGPEYRLTGAQEPVNNHQGYNAGMLPVRNGDVVRLRQEYNNTGSGQSNIQVSFINFRRPQ